jgi:hypothetical protein
MERKKLSEEVMRFQKLGGGSFYAVIDGKQRIIKPGEVFIAKLEDIPEAFRDSVKPMDGGMKTMKEVVEKQEETIAEVAESVFSLKHKGGAWYDVVDVDGKVMNEKSLRKADAEKLISSLKG